MFDKPVLWLLHATARILTCKFPSAKGNLAAPIARPVYGQSQTLGPSARPSRICIAPLKHKPNDQGEHEVQRHLQDVPTESWPLACAGYPLACATGQSAASSRYLALPQLTRHILYLSRREGMDGAQIAVHLGLPRQTVRRHLRRAVAALAAP